MNKHLKKGLILGGIGFAVGLGIGFVLAITEGSLQAEGNALRILVGGLYGGFGMGTSAVYDIDTWSVAKSSIIHFVVTLLGFYAFAMVEGWMDAGDEFFCIMTAMFIFTYFMIWMFQYLAFVRQIKGMNDDLKVFRESRKER